jgi:hypothetical protein
VTAVTGSPATAQSGRPLSSAVPNRPAATTPGANLAPLSPQVAAAARGVRRATSGQGHQVAATAAGAGTKPVARPPTAGPAGGARGPLPDHGEPASVTPVEGGPESAIFAYVDELDGSERKVLLNHIAQAWPDVVGAVARRVSPGPVRRVAQASR